MNAKLHEAKLQIVIAKPFVPAASPLRGEVALLHGHLQAFGCGERGRPGFQQGLAGPFLCAHGTLPHLAQSGSVGA